MKLKTLLAASAATFATTVATGLPLTSAHAQETTAAVRGVVTDEGGAPVAGATVVVTDTRTGATRTLETSQRGTFSARSLTVGGPYTISARAPGREPRAIEGVRLALGQTANLDITLASGMADEIVVTGTRNDLVQLAPGPSATFDFDQAQSFPSIQRDIRDVIRIDPRVNIDLANEVPRVSCLGGNDRSNTFTVDGVIRADAFGLNGTGFASRNTFIVPFDAISQTSVEFAPYDVEYGQFTGCNINVVTKSGTNEFHGSAFGFYTGDGLQGTTLEGEDFDIAPFDDYNWGATLGGPIVKDKLFFFYAYEETDDADPLEFGPSGSGFVNEFDFIDTATANELIGIVSDVYGVEAGGIPSSLPQSSVRHLARFDFQVTDDHRAEFTYDRLRESNIEDDDATFGGRVFTPFGSFEDEGTESDTYSFRLFSQWTDRFSTELRASRAEVQDLQGPVGGGEAQDGGVPRIAVGVSGEADADGNVPRGIFLAGPGQFRSANDLQTETDQIKVLASYDADRHFLTAGYELNSFDVFNLFIQNATGTLTFSDIDALRDGELNTGPVDNPFLDEDDIADGTLAGAFGNFSFDGDPASAAAAFKRDIHAFYLQDEWRPTDDVELVLGLRYETYEGDETPLENPTFIERYGFSNARDFGDLDILLPRVALTYDLPDQGAGDLTLRLGSGLFTGGDPTVWFSNAFANAGGNIGGGSLFDAEGCEDGDTDVVEDGVFTGFPDCVVEAGAETAQGFLGDTRSTDPDLELQSVLRSNIGLTWLTSSDNALLDGWKFDFDYIHTRTRNPYNFVDLAQAQVGVAADGRPVYAAIDPSQDGCDAMLQGMGGTPPVYTGLSEDCFGTRRDDEIQLTNADGFSSHSLSAIANKGFDYTAPGIGKPGSLDLTLGYAFQDNENRRDLTSSRSVSNFDGDALFDRQNPGVATSGFEVRHTVTLAANLRQEFIDDHDTSLGLFFSATEGRPFSYTFDGGGVFNDSASGNDNALLYLPNSLGDPLISPESDFEAVEQLGLFANQDECLSDYFGQVVPRNACRNDWFLDLDLRLAQELPIPGRPLGIDDKLTVFMDIDNVANLISSEANLRRQVNDEVDLVDVALDEQGRFIISGFNPDEGEEVNLNASVWSIQFGARYQF